MPPPRETPSISEPSESGPTGVRPTSIIVLRRAGPAGGVDGHDAQPVGARRGRHRAEERTLGRVLGEPARHDAAVAVDQDRAHRRERDATGSTGSTTTPTRSSPVRLAHGEAADAQPADPSTASVEPRRSLTASRVVLAGAAYRRT